MSSDDLGIARPSLPALPRHASHGSGGFDPPAKVAFVTPTTDVKPVPFRVRRFDEHASAVAQQPLKELGLLMDVARPSMQTYDFPSEHTC
jgi:hypothetical protein